LIYKYFLYSLIEMTEFKYDTEIERYSRYGNKYRWVNALSTDTSSRITGVGTFLIDKDYVQIKDDKKHKAELREEIYETNKLVSGFMDDVGVKESKMVECIFELKSLVAEQQKNITRLTSLLLKQKEQIEEQRLQIFNINHPPLATSLSDVPKKLKPPVSLS